MTRIRADAVLRGRSGRFALADLGLAVLALATVAVVGRALDVPAPRAASLTVVNATTTPAAPAPSSSPSSAPTTGGPWERAVVAFDDRRSWRWLGGEICDPARPSRPVEASVDGRTWAGSGTPLHWVADLGVRPGLVVAVGADRECAPAASVSLDGGSTWARSTVEARAVDLAADAVWVIDAADVLRVGPALDETAPVGAAPCAAADAGPASLVEGISAREALVLCQLPDGGDRLLVHTGDGGRSWRRYAGKRVETGLASGGRIVSLSMVDGGVGLAVIRGGGCPQGEIRATSDGGTLWRTVRCAAVPALTDVLVAEMRDQRQAVLVGVAPGGHVQSWSSADAGSTWTRL